MRTLAINSKLINKGRFRLDGGFYLNIHSFLSLYLEANEERCVKLEDIAIFQVITFKGIQALKVIEATNSSLKADDILFVEHLRRGEILESKVVYRGDKIGNYRTNGEILEMEIIKV